MSVGISSPFAASFVQREVSDESRTEGLFFHCVAYVLHLQSE